MSKESTVISDVSMIEDIFDQKNVKKGIPPTFQTPDIGAPPKTITFQPIIDSNGNPQLVEIVNLDTGRTPYLRVCEYGKPEVVYKLALGKSLSPAMNAIRNDPSNGFTSYNDFIGKTVSILSSPYAEHPCKECNRKAGGCKVCGGTGHSKVYSLTLRNDLMSVTKNAKSDSSNLF